MYRVGPTEENIKSYGNAIASIPVEYTQSDIGCNPYGGPDGSHTLRASFDYDVHDYHRPYQSLPVKHKDIVGACQKVYKRVGLVRNIIDLMTDFCVQGIRLVHPNERIETFYQSWFARINGVDRSERFCSSIFKNGSAVFKRRNAKLSKSDKKKIYNANAADIIDIEHAYTTRGTIPWEYTFLNPATVELVGGSLATFSNNKQYQVRIPSNFFSYNTCDIASNAKQEEILMGLPPDIRDAVRTGNCFPLNPESTLIFHYKKDDWEQWPTPIIYSILRDIDILERMKLADLSALDGAIDNIRIFKLGSLEEKIWPEDGAFSKLASVLAANTLAGQKDLVWGPDIELLESKSEVYKFLGDDKYRPILNAIYAGLGIPPTLTGTDNASGTTNNLISLKTLIRRLEYVRSLLIDFWTYEIELVRKAMNFSAPATIEFDNNNLGEEEAEKKLWIELAERNIISDEAVLRKFGTNPRVERSRVKREEKQRKGGQKPPKASPYHNPDFENSIRKSLIDKGLIDPADIDKPLEDVTLKEPEKNPQQPGRPKNSKDTAPRKSRSVSPVINAGYRIWGEEAQAEIANILSPIFLEYFGKKNLRSLSASEAAIAEDLKFGVLLDIEPMSNISEDLVVSKVGSPISGDVLQKYAKYKDLTEKALGRRLNLKDLRQIQLEIYLGKQDG